MNLFWQELIYIDFSYQYTWGFAPNIAPTVSIEAFNLPALCPQFISWNNHYLNRTYKHCLLSSSIFIHLINHINATIISDTISRPFTKVT